MVLNSACYEVLVQFAPEIMHESLLHRASTVAAVSFCSKAACRKSCGQVHGQTELTAKELNRTSYIARQPTAKGLCQAFAPGFVCASVVASHSKTIHILCQAHQLLLASCRGAQRRMLMTPTTRSLRRPWSTPSLRRRGLSVRKFRQAIEQLVRPVRHTSCVSASATGLTKLEGLAL